MYVYRAPDKANNDQNLSLCKQIRLRNRVINCKCAVFNYRSNRTLKNEHLWSENGKQIRYFGSKLQIYAFLHGLITFCYTKLNPLYNENPFFVVKFKKSILKLENLSSTNAQNGGKFSMFIQKFVCCFSDNLLWL